MSSLILPDDPEFYQPLIMGNPYNGLTPKTAREKRVAELDASRPNDGTFKYAASAIAHAPDAWYKQAQMTGSSNVMTNPMWFSPLHTAQNWQIASKRREVYQWSFLSDDENPCYLTNYGDFSLIDIRDVVESMSSNILAHNDKEFFIQNNRAEKSYIDKSVKRLVNKKANKITTMGVIEPTRVTHDHDCIVILKEDIKCKYDKKTNCIFNRCTKTCVKNNCNLFENKNYKISKIKANDVKKGDYFLTPFSTQIQKSIIKTIEQARFAGHLAADGWVCNSNKYVGFGICCHKNEHDFVFDSVDKVLNDFDSNNPIYNPGNSSMLLAKRTSNKEANIYAQQLIKNKGSEKKFTDEVMLLDPELQLHVLGSYIQSDGTFNKFNKNIEITIYSKHLANQILTICYRCGILACGNKQPISKSQKTFKTSNTHRYIIQICSSESKKLGDYCPGKLLSKTFKNNNQQKRFFWKNYVVSPRSSNESFDYKGHVYDIRVPPTYAITANGVAIHQCRFFFENEPKVAAAISFYCDFPMNGFSLECEDRKVLKFFEYNVVKKLNLNKNFKYISTEYFTLGDVFAHLDVDCKICSGTAIDPDTHEICNHPGGLFNRIQVLNPDWIEVQKSVLAEEPMIVMVPDEELKRIVFLKTPRQIYDRIPDSIKKLVLDGRPIPLSNRTTSHIRHMAVPYGTYGTSLIRRLFTTLAYKTKIMTANWIVAERMILPIRVVKIGSDARPATSADISDIQEQLAAVANDPNVTIVTHHNFEYEWFGACYDETTEVLTDSGFKTYDQVDISKDKILTYDVNKHSLVYDVPLAKQVYDYDGEMVWFKSDQVDVQVTPNHRMLVRGRKANDWKVCFADCVKPGHRFLSHAKFENSINPEFIEINGKQLDIRSFLSFIGYYLSEGSLSCTKSNYQVSVSQIAEHNVICSRILDTFEKLGFKHKVYSYADRPIQWTICNKELCLYLKETFGSDSYSKHIPGFIKNLSREYLEILLQSLIDGDAAKIKHINTNNFVYTSVSYQLACDVQEIAFKCGYKSTLKKHLDTSKSPHQILYRVQLSKGLWSKGYESRIKSDHITKTNYKGKVWCFTVPNGFFVTRRNGKITIQGNSGKILQVTQELEYIGKEILDGFMLNQSLLNGEMCLTDDCEVLTSNGYKLISDVKNIDYICEWDKVNEHYIYRQPEEIIKYDNVEHVYEILSGEKILFKCSAKHKILLVNDMWELADSLNNNSRKKTSERTYRTITAEDLSEIHHIEAKTLLYNGTTIIIDGVRKINYGKSVYCFTTRSGYFVAKYQNIEFVSSNSGYQCHDVDQTETLTESGFKKYDDVTEKDKIATFNKETESIEYHPFIKRHEYDYDGEMIHISSKRIDCFVTPNHKMLVRESRTKTNWKTIHAADITSSYQLRSVAKYVSNRIPPKTVKIDDEHELSLVDYIKLVCYFATEGSVRKETRKERKTFGEPSTTTIYQSPKGKAYGDIQVLSESVSYRVRHYAKYDMFCIHNKKLSWHLMDVCGNHSLHKKIPHWIKDLPIEYLQLALNCIIAGDGYYGKPVKAGKKYGMEVKSKQLAEDLCDLAFKCGYSPLMSYRVNRELWTVDFSDAPRGRYPYIKNEYINKKQFKGRVFCFTVPNGFFVTRRNGKVTIQGNSAQVGVETLIRRIESWRHDLADWAEEHIFKPVAEMQGFVDKKMSEDINQLCFLYPQVKWNDLDLKDKTQYYQLMMQMHDKGVISTQTLCEITDINYDQEVKRLRYEQTVIGPMGGGLGQGAGGAGGMGAPGGGGGAPPGGMPMDPMGGMGGGMGGMGGMGAPGGGMGDMGGAGGAPGPMASGGKVLKKGKSKQDHQEMMPAPMIKLTSIEQSMAKMLEKVGHTLGWSGNQIQENIRIQFPLENHSGHAPYKLDFAFPHLKIAVEADGDAWHSQPEQIQDDQERDAILARRGWTVLRFDDRVINDSPKEVEATIISYIKKALNKHKTASVNDTEEQGEFKLFSSASGAIKELSAADYFVSISKFSSEIFK